MRLIEDGDGPGLEYAVEANVGGKLAQIGSRLIESSCRKFAASFFEKFTGIVETPSG